LDSIEKGPKFASDANKLHLPKMEDINRIKVVLVEKKMTAKWLAEALGKDTSTVSRWCTNTTQPDLETLTRIADLLGIETRDLLNNRRKK